MRGVKVSIQLKDGAKPVARRGRRIQAPLEEQLVVKLKKAEEDGIIEKSDSFSGWQHALVVAFKKSGEPRICVDLRPLNTYVVRQPHPFPSFEEMSNFFSGATVFSKLDIQDAFHQIELDEGSRDLTTFTSSIGTYRYCRLPFGLSSAPELFHRIIGQKLAGLHNVINFLDDVMVVGATLEDHDRALAAVLQRFDWARIRLNLNKCELRKSDLEFLGYKISAAGIAPSPSKVEALKNCRPPQTKLEAQSFLGLVSYVGHRFIPNLAATEEPIRRLTQKNVKFEWKEEQQKAFEQLIDQVTAITNLNFYSLSKNTLLYADASPHALAAVLAQKGDDEVVHPIAFASKSLSKSDQRLSQTEKEAMALVWAIEHFDYFLKGRHFDLYTDHKALEVIFSIRKPTSSLTSARIERWLLRIQDYQFEVKYIQGKKMIADFCSRACKLADDEDFDNDTDHAINAILQDQIDAISEDELRDKSVMDAEFEKIREALKSGKWSSELKRYETVQSELTVIGGILLRGHKIVVPKSLRQQLLNIIHEGHPGISRMKSRLRQSYWWPGMSKEAEDTVKKCNGCRLMAMNLPAEPLKRTLIPDEPWECIGIDFLSLPSGQKLLVVVDYFSRFVVVAIMRETTAAKVIEELQTMFNIYGYPKRCLSDNGPPFTSKEFEDWMKSVGIKLAHAIPYQPRVNGEVERFNRSLVKVLTISFNTGGKWRDDLNKFLVSYHQTPHTVTGVPPNELFFKRRVRDKLPTIETMTLPMTWNEDVRDQDVEAKLKGKKYADKKYRYKESNLEPGDLVVMKRQMKTKWQSKNDPTIFKVLNKMGSAVSIVGPSGKSYIRAVNHLTKIPKMRNDEPNAEAGPVTGAVVDVPNEEHMDTESDQGSDEDVEMSGAESESTTGQQGLSKDNTPQFIPNAASTPGLGRRTRKPPQRFGYSN